MASCRQAGTEGDTMTTRVCTAAVVYGRPYPQGSMRAFNNIVVQGGSATSKANLEDWRQRVTHELDRQHQGQPFDGACQVDLAFRFTIPPSRTKKAVEGQWRTITPDLDKLVRAVLDAATRAGVWVDDSQVVDLSATKTETHGAEGVSITIRHLP